MDPEKNLIPDLVGNRFVCQCGNYKFELWSIDGLQLICPKCSKKTEIMLWTEKHKQKYKGGD